MHAGSQRASETTIVIVCPDTNIKLWAGRTREAALGGGKSAILQLASAWARAGNHVTIAGQYVVDGEGDGVSVRRIERAAGRYDVAVYVSGSLGHFDVPGVHDIHGACRILWQNGPGALSRLPEPRPDWFVVPARFLARRGIDEWGYPSERVVCIPGEAVTRRLAPDAVVDRHESAIVYASAPFKGLDNAVEVVRRVRPDHPGVSLDVYGSAALHGDHIEATPRGSFPDWVRFHDSVPQSEVEASMPKYGAMLYVTSWVDGFSLATAEALAGGVIVIATAHGSQAEFILHGWNGLLVSSDDGNEPDLAEGERLLRLYLADPAAFRDMRARAASSVPTWDEQAARWMRIWRSAV